ncbi:MAG: DUF4097 family beta strand repeat-containing protein [Bryobacteraceae bacterium]
MRPKRSIAGPLILIAIGVLFLMRAISPDFSVIGIYASYWPYLLIAWGAIEFLEISIRFLAGSPVPLRTISGGGWFAVLVICCAGLLAHAAWQPHTWWHRFSFHEGVQMFGDEHTYPIPPVQKSTGPSPHVIIENFRGDAKITGTDGNTISLTGHKAIRSFNRGRADAANAATPVVVALDGNTVVIRCNQDRAEARTPVTTDLEISLPKGASLEAAGTHGDFDISALSGDVDLTTRGGSAHIDDIGGGVTIDTHRGDLIRCTAIKGAAVLRGDGNDVELDGISGPVTVDGHYPGTLALRHLSQHVHVSNFRTEFDAQKVGGEIRLDGGNLSAEEIAGPVKLTAHATDVSLNGFTGTIEVSVDSGDIALAPQHLPLSPMTVRTHAGNIDLALPPAATFALTALAHRGDVRNTFSDTLQESNQGPGTRLEGNIGTGPQLNLVTGSGNVILRKASVALPGNPSGTDKTVSYTER